jgi:type VI secretion system protein ImpA
LKQVPISRPQTKDLPVCTWAEWERAIGATRPTAARDGDDEERVRESVAATPVSFSAELVAPLASALAALDALDRSLGERCDDQAPSLARFRDILARVKHFAAKTVAERTGAEAAVSAPAAAGAVPVGAADDGGDHMDDGAAGATIMLDVQPAWTTGATVAPIRCRADAYGRLAEIAEYLLAIEPHSPAPYLIKRAVAWSHMPLGELLAELLQATGDLQSIYTLLAINQGGEP